MDRLLTGYRRFRQDHWPGHRREFEGLAKAGQHPRAMIISCADSRVDPGMIFDAHSGELFVLRNVANLVHPYARGGTYHGTSAALEFAVRVLKVPDIMVMGHALCGGVRALLEGPPREASDFVEHWVTVAAPARERALARANGEDPHLFCEQETILLSLENLMTFPWIAERVNAGELRLVGAHFDIRSGELSLLSQDGQFEPAAVS